MGNSIAFYTLGCRVNYAETAAMEELFINSGYNVVKFEDSADIYVINTCTVTIVSERKSRNIIRRAKKMNSNAVVVVAGCYAQMSSEEIAAIEGVNIVVGTKDKSRIEQLVSNYISGNDDNIDIVSDIFSVTDFENIASGKFSERSKAFMKIQDGCNNYCSYCIVPFARGHSRSKLILEILSETSELVGSGYTDIVLTGIHIASYGNDLIEKGIQNEKLTSVIEQVASIDGVRRIGIGSLEPGFVDDDFLSRISKLPSFAPHFHLSLQSGSDKILKAMNRKYTAKVFISAVKLIRDYYPNAGITTDIIVGFPGESEQDFEMTIEVAKEIGFSWIHVFKYSPRKGTAAYNFTDKVADDVKENRSVRLVKLAKQLQENFLNKNINYPLEVHFEKELSPNTDIYEGYTSNFIKAQAESNRNIAGKFFKVYPKSVEDDILIVELQTNY